MAPESARRNLRDASTSPRKETLPDAAAQHHTPRQNHLLDALPADDYARLEPHLELAGAVAAVHEMRMAIDQSRRHHAAFAVNRFEAA